MQLVIYIPGLGGPDLVKWQARIIERWNNQHRRAVLLQSNWSDIDENITDKITRIKQQAIALDLEKYDDVLILGSSAGGSLGLNLFAELKELSTVRYAAICGKITEANRIGAGYSKPNPALIPSVELSENLVKELRPNDLKRLITVIPLFDPIVPLSSMEIPGAKTKRQFSFGHSPSIALGLTLFRGKYLRKPKAGL